MIKQLFVRNYAIIEKLEISFSDKLTIVTGETGAGKSILLGALGLIMGKRADTKVLYNQEEKCVVEAFFDIQHYNLQSFFEEQDIDFDKELIIRRELSPSGKSRAFINDTPVNLGTLKQLTSALIDMHQQFDTLDIHNVSFQLRIVDALANNQERVAKYSALFKAYKTNQRKLDKLIQQNETAAKELDFLEFQFNEFEEAELADNEQETLEVEQKTLSSSEEIKSSLTKANQLISESDYSILNQLTEISNSLSGVSDVNPQISSLYERLSSIIYELQDLANEAVQIGESTEYNEERIAEITNRLDILYKLQSKHSVTTIQELLDIQNDLQKKIDAYGDLSTEIEDLEAIIDEQEDKLGKQAETISRKRKGIVKDFEKKVHLLLAQLSMEHATLKVDIQETEELTETGMDSVNFLFSANKGGRFELIKDVASGGEISRLTLCAKSLVADAIPLPTLIYDEIDAGVSGDVALKMGRILHDLSLRHQVVSITHTPQIAAKADRHYFAFKQLKGNRTFTQVKELNKEEKIIEIATMLSGSPPTQAAVKNASELLVK